MEQQLWTVQFPKEDNVGKKGVLHSPKKFQTQQSNLFLYIFKFGNNSL